ncbi:putative ABC transport system permease protein [Dyadobacter soli]|uniref:Putative ABC transport system permease protein n=1 Tax=Dyadobacter soli TaxID=659014 RepID=A0A1G7CV95_9BACT|nr:ABC transporter permease [Dyadobacter soli]SDE43153.1 putative ABC transport system permease protein [Dyadobacter soli]
MSGNERGTIKSRHVATRNDFFVISTKPISMLRNYAKIAVRNIWKHRLFSIINVFGLASGLMICLLAIAHIKGAFDYDNFHPKRNQIYRVLTDVTTKENDRTAFASSPLPLAATLKTYSFVENTARVVRTYGEVSANTKKMNFLTFAVDPSFYQLFGYRIVAGNAATRPGTAMVSQKTAEKLFGRKNPIGQVLDQDGIGHSIITGVLANVESRSHLRFEILISVSEDIMARFDADKDWNEFSTGYTYALLKPGTAAAQLEHVLPELSRTAKTNLRGDGIKDYSFRAQPLSGISPSTEELMNGTYEPQTSGLSAEMGVGLVTLLMAAFNYINLTLARSMSRAREIGIRKTSGALRWQLVGQFMAESVLLSLLALALAFVMLEMVRPMQFVQQWLIAGVAWDWKLWSVFIAFSILVGLLAGLVPARVLSGFQPAEVLRSRTGLKIIRGISFRKALIVAQFSISLIAMVALVTMMRQQHYMATADYGFQSKNVINIPLNGVPFERLANEIDKLAGVEHVSGIVQPFGHHGPTMQVKSGQNDSNPVVAFQFDVAPDFVKTLGLSLVAGKELLNTAGTANLVIVNEEAVRKLNLGDSRSAVGKSVWLQDSTEVQIAGVVKDFRFTSFVWEIKPLILRPQISGVRYLQAAVASGTNANVEASIKGIWAKLSPYEPFEGQWYDDFLYEHHSHADDLHFMALLLGISFSIACLGLLGMVTYNTQTRVKEVGIRKVLGAKIAQIIWLLSRDFVKLLAIAAAIALPLGYVAGYAFLASFAYHVSIGFETLGLCFGLLLFLGSLIITTRTFKVASGNPVDALANE